MNPPRWKCVHRTGRGKPSRPAAASEPHQHRLGNVVLLMGKKEHPCLLFEKDHPRRARLGLAGVAMALAPPSGDQFHAKLAANTAAKGRIAARLRSAQPVVEVERAQPAAPRWPMRPNQQQQGQRIGAA